MPFETNAFLGKQIEVIRNKHVNNNKEILTLLNEINREFNKILHNLKHTNHINKDYFIIGLLCKIIQSYNSVIILSNYGLESDSKVVLRTMMESTFNLRAIIYDEEYFNKYLQNGDKQTLSLINNINRNQEIFSGKILSCMSNKKTNELKECLSDFKVVHMSDLASLAKMKDVYLYTYNLLSLDTHGNAKAIANNYIISTEGKATKLNISPSYNNLDFIFSIAITLVLKVVGGINEYFSEDFSEFIEKYESELKQRYG